MKIQTSAVIEQLLIGDKKISLPAEKGIELEFSAIDTGGGFKDPILDFSFTLDSSTRDLSEGEKEVVITLRDPSNEKNRATFSHRTVLKNPEGQKVEINGRLKEDDLERELIGFVLQLLR